MAGAPGVSASPFPSLGALTRIMRLVPPDAFQALAGSAGFGFRSERILALPSGKRFSLQIYEV